MKLLSVFVLPAALLAAMPVRVSEVPAAERADGFASPGGAFTAAVEFSAGNSEFVPLERFELRDRTGRPVYSRSGDGHTVLDISEQGIVVGADFDGPVSGAARLVFYDAAGNRQGTADIGFYNQRSFSADGSRFCVLDGRAGLRVFTAAGRELYNLGTGNRFAVSADGSRIALAQDREVRLFRDGVPTGRIPLESPFVRQMVFSADGTRLGLIDRHALRLFRVADSNLEFEFQPDEAGLDFISLDIGPEAEFVLAGLDFGVRGRADRHKRGAVVMLDRTGRVVWRRALEYQNWNFAVPAVRFGPGRSFQVRTAEAVSHWQY